MMNGNQLRTREPTAAVQPVARQLLLLGIELEPLGHPTTVAALYGSNAGTKPHATQPATSNLAQGSG